MEDLALCDSLIFFKKGGNFQLKRGKLEADSGEVVGILGDYLQEFYTKKFSKSFNQSKIKKILKGDDIPDFYKYAIIHPKNFLDLRSRTEKYDFNIEKKML